MIDIMYIGIDQIHPDNFVYGTVGNDYWLLLEVKSKAIFHTVQGSIFVNPGCVVVYPPNAEKLYYQANGEPYINSYIRFKTDEDFIINGNYPKGVPINISLSSNIGYLLRILSSEVYVGDSSSEVVKHVMKTIFQKLVESSQSAAMDEHRKKLIELRYKIIVSPQYNWSIEELAKEFHVSPGYLSVLYKKEFGISCKDDIVNHRLELAKDLLANTSDPAVKIAEMCGYSCVAHFTRQFKKKVGMTPTDYRNSKKL